MIKIYAFKRYLVINKNYEQQNFNQIEKNPFNHYFEPAFYQKYPANLHYIEMNPKKLNNKIHTSNLNRSKTSISRQPTKNKRLCCINDHIKGKLYYTVKSKKIKMFTQLIKKPYIV